MVELLTTIVIISILSTVAIAGTTRYLAYTREKTYKTFEDTLYNATRNYLSDNTLMIPSCNGGRVSVSSDALKTNNYLDVLQDPKDKSKECSGSITITNNTICNSGSYNPKLTYNVFLTCIGYSKVVIYP